MSEHHHSLKRETFHKTVLLLYQVLTKADLSTHPSSKTEQGDRRQRIGEKGERRGEVGWGAPKFVRKKKNVKFWQEISSETCQSPGAVSQRRKPRYHFDSEHFCYRRLKLQKFRNVQYFHLNVFCKLIFHFSVVPGECLSVAVGELEGS